MYLLVVFPFAPVQLLLLFYAIFNTRRLSFELDEHVFPIIVLSSSDTKNLCIFMAYFPLTVPVTVFSRAGNRLGESSTINDGGTHKKNKAQNSVDSLKDHLRENVILMGSVE